MIEVRRLAGAALSAALQDVARLRISVFRDWPYLYDGDMAYEEKYLQTYRESSAAILVGAFDGARLIGASTGSPLSDHKEDFAEAFAGQDLDISKIFYCAESVLLPAYRGQGLGHAFFDAREAHARHLGYAYSAFCAVIRPPDHPLRPDTYRPLDAFWQKRGYQPLKNAVAEYSWKDLDDASETPHPLQFWIRSLAS